MQTIVRRSEKQAERGGAMPEGTAIILLMFGLIFLVVDLSLALYGQGCDSRSPTNWCRANPI